MSCAALDWDGSLLDTEPGNKKALDMAGQGGDGTVDVEMWVNGIGSGTDHDECRLSNATPGLSTPPSEPLRLQEYEEQKSEESSPTDSNFSTLLGFDSPLRLRFARTGEWSDVNSDFDTGASSIEDEDEVAGRKKLFNSASCKDIGSADLTTQPTEAPLTFSSAILDDPRPDRLPNPTPLVDFDPSATHLISLTDCLQCVLSDLPCSRTLPTCLRCIRNGHGALCLVQRKRLHVEVFNEHGIFESYPILLKREGDDPDVYEQKCEMQKAVNNNF